MHRTISGPSAFRPLHSQVRQSAQFHGHSNHRYFLDSRPIMFHIYFSVFSQQAGSGLFEPTANQSYFFNLGTFQPTSPSFRQDRFPDYACRSIRESVLGRYSFHSTFRTISSLLKAVLHFLF